MSIANEIVRLKNAKESMKTALLKRGAQVEQDAAIDLYPQILEDMPYAVSGAFTPEEDSDTFEMNALSFEPQAIMVTCNDFEDVIVPASIVFLFARKNNLGGVYYYTPSSDKKYAVIKSSSDVVAWSENGVNVKVAAANSGYFKKGYTYRYVVSGGFNQ